MELEKEVKKYLQKETALSNLVAVFECVSIVFHKTTYLYNITISTNPLLHTQGYINVMACLAWCARYV